MSECSLKVCFKTVTKKVIHTYVYNTIVSMSIDSYNNCCITQAPEMIFLLQSGKINTYYIMYLGMQGRIQDFSMGGLKAMVIYKLYYIYCNYSHYYFKQSALYPTESYRCMNLLAAVPTAQQLYS